jgi:hypothetical protein
MRESQLFRVFALIWAIISLLVAFCAFGQMFVTYAPPRGHTGERAQEDLRLMYGVLSGVLFFDWAASAMLAASAILVVWLAFRRTPQEN